MTFFEEEFIDQFPDCDPWLIFGLCQLSHVHSSMMSMNIILEEVRGRYDLISQQVVRLMSDEQLQWSMSRCHPNTPYGGLFATEIAERLLIGKRQV
jgi:hypothetical protein